MTTSSLFPVRLAAGWLAAAALAFAFSFYLMTRDTGASHAPDDTAATITSKSALGYATLYHALARIGIAVGENTMPSGPPRSAAVVVIAEPAGDEATLAHVRSVLRRAPAVLLVLPKRVGEADPRHPDRIRYARLVPLRRVASVLALVDGEADVSRAAPAGAWSMHDPVPAAPTITAAQVVHSAHLRPLLSGPGGMLIGESRDRDRRVIVVSDPDIFENHGIVRGENAAIAAALVRDLRAGRTGGVVFDETTHGIISHPYSAMRLLFGFPFVLVTAQIAIATALLLWSGSARFGVPRPREPTLPLGKRGLIESGSRLLEHVARLPFLTERYADAVVRDTALRINAPRGLTVDQLVAWFERTGRAVPPAAGGAHGATGAAEAMYRWREHVLDESGQRTQHR